MRKGDKTLRIRSRRLSWPGSWLSMLALALVVGCGRPQEAPPPPPPPVRSVAPSSPKIPMSPFTFAKGSDPTTFANRGITDWKVTPSSDGKSVRCSFRSTPSSETHYGGLAMWIPGDKAFWLTVKIAKGAPAVRWVYVWAFGPGGKGAGQWDDNVRAAGVPLVNDEVYVWQFAQGQPVTPLWGAKPGEIEERQVVHLFLDVDPGQDVSFTVEKAEVES